MTVTKFEFQGGYYVKYEDYLVMAAARDRLAARLGLLTLPRPEHVKAIAKADEMWRTK